ncbi:hypothetical protein D9M69_581220 [compost metagenome]
MTNQGRSAQLVHHHDPMRLIIEKPESVLDIRTRFVEEQPLGEVMIEGQFQRLAVARLRIGHTAVEILGCFIGECGCRIEPGH